MTPAAFLALLALALPASAQVPLATGTQPAEPYTLLDYADSRFELDLPPGHYFIVYSAQSVLGSEYWIRQGGRTLSHFEDRGGGGGTAFDVPGQGPVIVEANGQGSLAIVDSVLVDNSHRLFEQGTFNATTRNYAFALARDVSPAHLCLAKPGTWTLVDYNHRPVRDGRIGNGTADIQFETEGIFQVLFLEFDAPGPFVAVVQQAPCDGKLPPGPAGSAPTPAPLALLGLAAALLLRRRSAARQPSAAPWPPR